jgi:hypothetical protein
MLLSYSGGGFTKVLPVRESNHDQAIELVAFLQSEWLKLGIADEERTRLVCDRFWEIIEAACLLIPTVPGLGWQFDKLRKTPELVQFFLLHPEGSFWKLHEFDFLGDTADRPNCLTDEKVDLLPENLPFPSSGNRTADKIASYLHGTEWGPGQIRELFEWCSREEIAGIQYTIGELANPDKRIDAEKKRMAENFYQTADPSLYDTDDPNFKWDNEA